MFHCLYCNTFTLVSSSSGGQAILVRRDSQLRVGDFTHHPDGRAIALELTYRDTIGTLEVQVAVGLDQFQARHLCPILRCTEAELCAVIPWRVDVMPPLTVTIDSTKRILRQAGRSTPFRDLVGYFMIEWLHDDQPQWVVGFIQQVSAGVPLRAIVHGDLYALPTKIPHGPIVNARPLLNLTTIWKLVSAHIADQCIPLLARAGVLPCTQFALHASSSVADLLGVLHDDIWFSFFRQRRVCLVVDDVQVCSA